MGNIQAGGRGIFAADSGSGRRQCEKLWAGSGTDAGEHR